MDETIRFLKFKIALCGKAGASTSQVFDFLKSSSYGATVAPTVTIDEIPGVTLEISDPDHIDANLRAAIWLWLVRQPGISVGRQYQANEFSLERVLEHNREVIARCLSNHENPEGVDDRTNLDSLHCVTVAESPFLKIYASEEQVWYAVAGHGIDYTRIPPRDFDCLCAIAQHGPAGVLQPEVVRITGQDPRSVPSRTQRLCDAGYVVKDRTLAKCGWTSLLTLMRYVQQIHDAPDHEEFAQSQPQENQNNTRIRGRHTDVEDKIRDALQVLDETQLIVWNDLKRKVGVFGDFDRSRSLATAMRHLESLGIVQRVKAQANVSAKGAKFHRCVKLLRLPSAEELRVFFRPVPFNDARLQADDEAQGVELPDGDDDYDLEAAELDNPVADELMQHVTPSAISSIMWNPDRQISHLVRDVVDEAGDDGITLPDLRESLVGPIYERPIDTVLSRLVDFAAISQPTHLRHLGLVRDTVAVGRKNMYIHYARHRLGSLLESGKISKDASALASLNQVEELLLDVFAFITVDQSTMSATSKSAVIPATVEGGGQSLSSGTKARSKPPSNKPRGRPRKYPKEGVPDDALSETERKNIQRSQHQAKLYEAKKKALEDQRDRALSRRSPDADVPIAAQLETPPPSEGLSDLPVPASSARKRGRPRRVQSVSPHQDQVSQSTTGLAEPFQSAISYFPSSLTHSTLTKSGLARLLKQTPIGEHDMRGETKKPQRLSREISDTPRKSRTYKEQVEDIPRSGVGCFVGQTCDLTRSGRGRRPKSRLGIIKSLALSDLPMFKGCKARDARRPGEQVEAQRLAVDNGLPPSTDALNPSASLQAGESLPLNTTDAPSVAQETDGHDEGVSRPDHVEANAGNVAASSPLRPVTDGEALINNILNIASATDVSISENQDAAPNSATSYTQQPLRDVNAQSSSSLKRKRTSPDLTPNKRPVTPDHREDADSLAIDYLQRPVHDTNEQSSSPSKRKRANRNRTPNKRPRLNVAGGSVAATRQQIILDVVEKAGGVYPGNKEMWYPFATIWNETHPQTKPDQRTVLNAQAALVAVGKLKQITFNFENKLGGVALKTIVAMPDIDEEDERIKDLQSRMIDADPRFYFPEGPHIADDLRIDSRRPLGPSQALPVEEQKVNLHHTPAYLRNQKLSTGESESVEKETRRRPTRAKRPGKENVESSDHEIEEPDGQEISEQTVPPSPAYLFEHPGLRSGTWGFEDMGNSPPPSYRDSSLESEGGFAPTAAASSSQTVPLIFGTKGYIPIAPALLSQSWSSDVHQTALESHAAPPPLVQMTSQDQYGSEPPAASQPSVQMMSQDQYGSEPPAAFRPSVQLMSRDQHDLMAAAQSSPSVQQQTPGWFVPIAPAPLIVAETQNLRNTSAIATDVLTQGAAPASGTFTSTEQREESPTPSADVPSLQTQSATERGKGERKALVVKPRKLASLGSRAKPKAPKPAGEKKPTRVRTRRPRVGEWTAAWIYRMFMAVSVSRILLGGIEMRIDWDVAAAMLKNIVPADRLRCKWNRVRRQFVDQVTTTNDSIREVIATGFENDTVPRINFNDLPGNDWAGFFDWTMKQVNRAPPPIELPKTRAELDTKYNIVLLDVPTTKTFYEDLNTHTHAGRRNLLQKLPRVELLAPSKPRRSAPSMVDIARTWVRATIAAPEDGYDPKFVEKKLLVLGNSVVEEALKSLRAERKLTQENKSRRLPGRSYDFSESYISKVSKNAEMAQLKDAARFKKVVDREFAGDGTLTINPAGDDGAFLAIINMVTHGQITPVAGKGLPGRKGLLDSGYQTRKMDKSRLMFEIKLEPSKDFTPGNPLDMSIPPPRPKPLFDREGNEITMIPMWFDINGNLVQVMWDLARAVVATRLNHRPFLTQRVLAEAVSLHLEHFEVVLVLDWLVAARVAEWKDDRRTTVVLTDWWWMALADTAEREDGAD